MFHLFQGIDSTPILIHHVILIGKGKAPQKVKAVPSREQMVAAVSDILTEVDFNTVSSPSKLMSPVLFQWLGNWQ